MKMNSMIMIFLTMIWWWEWAYVAEIVSCSTVTKSSVVTTTTQLSSTHYHYHYHHHYYHHNHHLFWRWCWCWRWWEKFWRFIWHQPTGAMPTGDRCNSACEWNWSWLYFVTVFLNGIFNCVSQQHTGDWSTVLASEIDLSHFDL